MPQYTKRASLRRGDPAQEEARRELLQSLAHTRTLINQAYGGFNNASDSDLIESYVFEINSLQARYNYLLRRVKELEGGHMTPLPGYMAWCLAGLLLCAALLLLRRPAARLLRLALRSSVGLAVLALFSQVSHLIGVSLGVNLVNALVLGALGAPGFGLLLMLQWALR